MNTNEAVSSNNNGQLVMFGQETARFFTGRDLKDQAGAVVGTTYAIAKRKDVAKAQGIDPKKQGAMLDKSMLAITDAAKHDMGRVIGQVVASPEFTGGRLTVRRNKAGLRAITARFVEVKRDVAPVMTAEQISAATGIPVAEVQARMTAEAKKQQSNVVDITINAAPEPLKSVPAPTAEAKK